MGIHILLEYFFEFCFWTPTFKISFIWFQIIFGHTFDT